MKRNRENTLADYETLQQNVFKKAKLQDLKTLILKAIEINDSDFIENLLKNHPLEILNNLKTEDDENFHAVHVAVKMGRTAIVKKILEFIPNKNITSNKGNSALHFASHHGHFDLVKLLLEKQIEVNKQNTSGNTPLHIATTNGYTLIVKALLEKGAFIYLTNNNGDTPLHSAAAGRDKKIVTLLLKDGAKVNIVNKMNVTPLIIAAESGDKEIVELLLQANAKPNAWDIKGETSLHKAAALGNLPMMEKLLQKGANLFEQDFLGKTPLLLAAENGNEKAVKLLIDQSELPSPGPQSAPLTGVPDYIGNTALHLAAKGGHLSIIKNILLAKIYINAKNENGESALILAAKEGHEKVVDLLLAEHAKVEIKNKDGYTAFLAAAQEGHIYICEKLKNYGANVNAKPKNYREETALHLFLNNLKTIQPNTKEKVAKLIELGIDSTPYIVEFRHIKLGSSAFQIATMKQDKESCKVIFNHSTSIKQVKDWMIERSAASKPYHDMVKKIITDFITQKEFLSISIENTNKVKYLHLYQYLIESKPEWKLDELGEKHGINDFLSQNLLKFTGICKVLNWTNNTFNRLPEDMQKNIYSYIGFNYLTNSKNINVSHENIKDNNLVEVAGSIHPSYGPDGDI